MLLPPLPASPNHFISPAHCNKPNLKQQWSGPLSSLKLFWGKEGAPPWMTEVSALMSPSCLMKLCFEITAGRGARGISAGNARSWSLFLYMWNTCKIVEKRTMVVSCVCMCVCVCTRGSFPTDIFVRCCFKCGPAWKRYRWMTLKQRNGGFHFMNTLQLLGKDSDAGKDWRQKEAAAEDDMVR